ncbi:hypothetical protein Drose_04495 [Dactylosporangium roseum]|uniref:Uncharacterized protein n=1 Tax=Dactylosporangium roseum TaxID=47989 RepID=A0ABY5Z7C0_9ACTN|nr:hypothetical protein [Dactylosporangium roseum]UWZ37549.1 hypothetical protein Drose_04495 [Dactylosporangium roseum]
MTAIGDIIQPGKSIPDDVTEVEDRTGWDHERGTDGRWHLGGVNADDPHPWSDGELMDYAPLTVTAVREPEPYTPLTLITCGTCGVRSMTCHYCGEEQPAQAVPLVLTLPQVPEGAVALIGGESGMRYPRRDDVSAPVWLDPKRGNATTTLAEILDYEGSVTVVMREPRTWPKLATEAEDPNVVDVVAEDGLFTHRWIRREGSAFYRCSGRPRCCKSRTLAGLRELGDVTEVFDDGGEPA